MCSSRLDKFINMNHFPTKRYLLLTAAFFLFTISAAQIKFISNIETGYENRNIKTCFGEFNNFHKSLFSVLNVGSTYKNFSLIFSNKTLFNSYSIVRYIPKQIEFYIKIKYEYNRFEIKYEHLCSHGIDNDYFFDTYNRFSINFKIL
jgi:hypothetical protein